MASIAAYKLMMDPRFARFSFAYFGYGGPRVGNKVYADLWNVKIMQQTRVVNHADFAPHFLIANYVHHGLELWNHGENSNRIALRKFYEDPEGSNIQTQGNIFNDHITYFDVIMTPGGCGN